MNQIVELLKSINYQIPRQLIFNYKKLNIMDNEMILIIYFINQNNKIYNPKQISNDLGLELNIVLEMVNSLSEKGILKVELKKINNIRSEIINLDYLYEKLAFSLNDVDDKKSDNIFSMFETEFGRTLSPMEYEIINSWISSGCSEELIKLALKEAVYNGVNSLRYIDKIIYDWGTKGIKNKEDVEKERKQFKNNNIRNNSKSDIKNKELFDYDWLNDRDN